MTSALNIPRCEMNKRLLLGAAFAAFATAAAGGASAQTSCPTGGGLVVCIEQVGDGNQTTIQQNGGRNNQAVATVFGDNNRVVIDQRDARNSTAAVTIRGDGNGQGRSAGGSFATRQAGWVQREVEVPNPLFPLGPRTVKVKVPVQDLDQGDGGNLTVESVDYGTVAQQGVGNSAVVSVVGDDNGFHIGQDGNDNVGVQLVAGDNNGAALLQDGNRNVAVQGLAGASSRSYLEQNGNGNIGVLMQASNAVAPTSLSGVMELAGSMEVGALSRAGGGVANTVMLEQSRNNNIAALAQNGSGNNLALRQPGNAFAAITQNGGNSLSITQTGSTPIIVTQR